MDKKGHRWGKKWIVFLIVSLSFMILSDGVLLAASKHQSKTAVAKTKENQTASLLERKLEEVEAPFYVMEDEKPFFKVDETTQLPFFIIIKSGEHLMTAAQKKQFESEIEAGMVVIVLPSALGFLEKNFPEYYQLKVATSLNTLALKWADVGIKEYMRGRSTLKMDKQAKTLKPNKNLHVLYEQNNEIGAAYVKKGEGRIYYASADATTNEGFWEYLIFTSAGAAGSRNALLRSLAFDGYTVTNEYFYKVEPGKEKVFTFDKKAEEVQLATVYMLGNIEMSATCEGGKVTMDNERDCDIWGIKGANGKCHVKMKNPKKDTDYMVIYLAKPCEKVMMEPFDETQQEVYNIYHTRQKQLLLRVKGSEVTQVNVIFEDSQKRQQRLTFKKKEGAYEQQIPIDAGTKEIIISYSDLNDIWFSRYYMIYYDGQD